MTLGLIHGKPPSLRWGYSDGGRAEAGYRGQTGDCVCRAIAITMCRPYKEVYDLINEYGWREGWEPEFRSYQSRARTGVNKFTTRQILADLGWAWTATMGIGTGCKVHLRAEELPPGRLIVQVSKHLVAVMNGIIWDTGDPSRDGTRCVYGYWTLRGHPWAKWPYQTEWDRGDVA